MPAGFCYTTQQYEESIIQAGVAYILFAHNLMQQHLNYRSFIVDARIWFKTAHI